MAQKTQAPAASAPAITPAEKVKVVKVISISEKAREINATATNGAKLIAREAVLLGANGTHNTEEVIGTKAQWDYFNGETVEATYRESNSRPGLKRWYFSPVATLGNTDKDAY